MSVLKSKEFTIDGLSGSYVLAMDDLFRVVGVYKDGNILNPSFDEWTDAVLSDESKVIRATYKGVAGESMSLVEPEVSSEFYNTESKKIENREQAQALIGSSVVQRSPLYAERPSFASPGAVRYSRSAATSTMAYPIDINESQDHLKISRYAYKRTSVNQSGPDGTSTSAGDLKGTLILPMPKVSDSNGAEWGESDLNVFGVAGVGAFKLAADVAKGATLGGLGDVFKNIPDLKNFTTPIPGAAAILGSVTASQVLKSAGISVAPDELLARATGFVANPNAELLFQGPVLRDFGFSFLMVARSAPEGKMIRKIIKFLKEGAAPKYQDNNTALLGTPDIFRLRYSSKKLNFFHDMALRTITVDYAPDGYWSAYDDSQPIALVMNLQFTEIKPVYDKDHRRTAEDSVGF
jgi:hypothetical protein